MIDAITVVIGLAALITLVTVLVGCAQCFHRFLGFKDEIQYQQDIESGLGSSNSLSSPDGTLHPPADSVDTGSINGITFDPLPNVSGQQVSTESSTDSEVFTINKAIANLREEASQYEIPRENLFYIAELGSGWFGQVLQGDAEKLRFGQTKTKVIVKMLKDDATPTERLRFLQDVMQYRILDHSNVIKFMGQCTEAMPYLAMLEHASLGDLKSYLLNNRENQENFIKRGNLLKFACEMAAGMACMHRHRFTHRDFAARNCQVSNDLSIKVGDYGISEEIYKEDYMSIEDEVVPIRWCAPEIITVNENSIKIGANTQNSNIWSFGVALWELFMLGEQPYSNMTNEAVIKQVIVEKFQQLPEPTTPVNWKSKAYDVMKFCWKDNRPSIEAVHTALQHLRTAVTETWSSDFDSKWKLLVDKKRRTYSDVSNSTEREAEVMVNGAGPPSGRNEVLVKAEVLMEDEVSLPKPKALKQLRDNDSTGRSFDVITPSKLEKGDTFQMTSTPVTESETSTLSSYKTAKTGLFTMSSDAFQSANNETPTFSEKSDVEGLSLSRIEVDPVLTGDLLLAEISGETIQDTAGKKVAEEPDWVSADPQPQLIKTEQQEEQVVPNLPDTTEAPADSLVQISVESTTGANKNGPPTVDNYTIEPLVSTEGLAKPDILEDLVKIEPESSTDQDPNLMSVVDQTDVENNGDQNSIKRDQLDDVVTEVIPVKVSDSAHNESLSLDLLVSDKHTDFSPSRNSLDFTEDISYRRRSLLSRDYGGMLATIPEDRVPSISDGSVTDLNFDSFDDSSVIQDNFEWDEDIGRQLVGMVQETSSNYSPRYGIELSDWSLDQSDVRQLRQNKRQYSSMGSNHDYSSILSSSVHISDESDEDDENGASGIFTSATKTTS